MEFKLGKLVTTNGVSELMNSNRAFLAFVHLCLASYSICNWG